MASVKPVTARIGTSRQAFVDLARGWAVLLMIEAHIFNEMLVPTLKETTWFKVLHYINGLVAPAFLFVSGFVFILASQRKREDLRTFGPAFWRLIGRIAVIWLIGYALHLPFHSFRKMLAATTEEGWLRFYQADILHCIAAGWLFFLVSFIAIKSDRMYRRWLFVSGLVTVLVTPFLWDVDFIQFIPAPIAAYLNQRHYSLFPLFPWLGFMLIGEMCGSMYVEAAKAGREREFMRNLAWIGGGLVIVGFLLPLLPGRLAYGSTSWKANPLFFAQRLACVFLFFSASWYCADKYLSASSVILDVGRESLLVYVAHILLIYKKIWRGTSLAQLYGKSLSPVDCILGTLALMILMVLGAIAWGWLKRHSLTASRLVSYATGVAALFIFLIREY